MTASQPKDADSPTARSPSAPTETPGDGVPVTEAPRPIVVDTSVAVKWYVSEEFRDEALTLFDAMAHGTIRGVAPGTIQPEFWNTLWQKRRRGELSAGEARSIRDEFAEDLMPRAIEIAGAGVIIYDALFVSLAEAMDTEVATDDDPLLRALKQTPFAALARHISNVGEFLVSSP